MFTAVLQIHHVFMLNFAESCYKSKGHSVYLKRTTAILGTSRKHS